MTALDGSSQSTFVQPPKFDGSNIRGTQSSFHVMVEEKKQPLDKTPEDISVKSPLTQFKVIQEDQEEHSNSIQKYENKRENSDYKRFDLEEEHQNLRLASQRHEEKVKEMLA